MKNYQYFTNLALECATNPDRRIVLINAFVKLAESKDDDQHELTDLFMQMPSDIRATIATLLAEGDNRYLYAYHSINHTSMFRNRSLSALRRFVDNNDVANDWDAIEELLKDSLDVVSCDDCDKLEYNDSTQHTYQDSYVCRECMEEDYRYSDHYDVYIRTDDSRWALDKEGCEVLIHEDDDNFHWDDDLDRYVHHDYEAPERSVIGNYHSSKNYHRPQNSPWTKLKKRYLGVELEVEIKDGRVNRNEKAKLLHEKINGGKHGKTVFFENDGSLSTGFEIITQPMGLDKHKELWNWLSDRDAVRGLISHNTTTCGLHVHVSKAGMSKLQIAKIVSFVNDPDNEQLIRAVARRYAEGYCRIKAKKIGESANSDDRYEAVNITPRHTIEFRIFKGSLKYESVMSAIQFSNALVEFCSRATTSVQDLKTDKFMEFMAKVVPEDTDVVRNYITQRLEAA